MKEMGYVVIFSRNSIFVSLGFDQDNFHTGTKIEFEKLRKKLKQTGYRKIKDQKNFSFDVCFFILLERLF